MLIHWIFFAATALATDPTPGDEDPMCASPLADASPQDEFETLIQDPRAGLRPSEIIDERMRRMGYGVLEDALRRHSYRPPNGI